LQEIDPKHLKPDQILDLSVSFAVLMRQHLGGMAVKMHETRMANVREAAGAHFEDDALNMFDPQSFYDHTKSILTLQTYFKSKTGTDNRRDKGGNNNNDNSHGNGRHNSDKNWNNNQDRRSQSRSGRDFNNSNRSSSSFQRNSGNQRRNSQQRGRSTSRRNDRSPRLEGGSKDS
ncbi:hypothetical protein KI688_006455, partial [Linnemannia hyalina]